MSLSMVNFQFTKQIPPLCLQFSSDINADLSVKSNEWTIAVIGIVLIIEISCFVSSPSSGWMVELLKSPG